MKKNLKSVISFVIALALSLSSMSAFAASYDDVPADASYAEAVANLTAIGVVEGYGDGKFNPDNNITRAEVAAMIVRALAQNEAAISSQGTTNFTDVAADHWASGYINVASRGNAAFINGMGDGTFAPEENVTYAQVVKMLVAGIGYGDWGVANGGYPTGYIATAKQLGITEGVASTNADENATRAVVAQLINNAIDTPLLALKVYSPTDPEYVIMDGTSGNDYETVLTYYHNIYKVEGRVTDTYRTTSGDLDADEVKFTVEKSDNYDGVKVEKSEESTHKKNQVMKTGETDTADYLGVYAKLMVKIEEDEDAVILSCVASGKNQSVDLVAKAWDDEGAEYGNLASFNGDVVEINKDGDTRQMKPQLWYYANAEKSGKSTRYYLNTNDEGEVDVKLYVNGTEIKGFTDSDVETYIFENKVGNVTLVDAPSEGSNSTDGKYDSIFVSYYATAVVESVSGDKVYFEKSANTNSNGTSIEFDEENDDLEYTITLNGEEIEYTDLQEGDVLSIAYDVAENATLEDSTFWDIIVSRDVAEGKVNEVNDEDNEVTIDGTVYGMVDEVLADVSNFSLGTSYSVRLDAFGNVVDFEKLASTVKYGIIYKAYNYDIEEEDRVVLYDTTATKKTFIADEDLEYIYYVEENGKNVKYTSDFAGLSADFGEAPKAPTKEEMEAPDYVPYNYANEYAGRVVTYATNSKGEITEVELLNAAGDIETAVSYSEKSSKLGSLKFDDNTVIISTNGKDFTVVSPSALVDDNTYNVAGFDKESGIYGLIIVTDGVGSYTTDSRFAVVEKVTQSTNEDGDEADKLSVYTAGSDELQVVYADGTGIVDDLNKGDVIIFTTNAAGVIEKASDVEVIFSAGTSYDSLKDDVDKADSSDWYAELFDVPSKWDATPENGADKVEVKFGPVIDRSSGDITIGSVDEDKCTNVEAEDALDYADDVAVYVYDYNNSSANRLSVGTVSSVAKTIVSKSIMGPSDLDASERYIIDWSNGR